MSGDDEQLVDFEEDEDEVVPARDSGRKGGGVKMKGRGHKDSKTSDRDRGGVYESLHGGDTAPGPAPSVEGWVIFVSGIHNEAQEDQVYDLFGDAGVIKNLQLNLDRRTGFVKGYALIEYGDEKEAANAIKELDGCEFLEQTLHVDWAFVKPSGGGKRRGAR